MSSIVQVVEHNSFGTSNATTISAVSSGNAVVAVLNVSNSSTGISCTDSASGTYTSVTSGAGNPLDASSTIYIFRRVNITNAPTSVTFSWTGDSNADAAVYEVSGLDNTTPVGQTGRSESATSTTTMALNLTTTTDSELAIGWLDFNASATFTPDSGYTTPTSQPSFFSGIYRANVGSAGGITIGGTTSGGVRYALVAATFRANSGVSVGMSGSALTGGHGTVPPTTSVPL